MKNVWSETPRAEGGDLALIESVRIHPETGDDLAKLFHGSRSSAIELHLHGLTPGRGAAGKQMLGDGLDTLVLTTSYDDALRYGDTVVQVDARGLELFTVESPSGGLHYATTDQIDTPRLSTPPAVGFENVLDPTLRSDCVAYARRYAPGPKNPARYEPDWTQSHTKPTYELEPGDRMPGGGVITRTEELPGTTVLVHVDGEHSASISLDYDAAATVHNDAVDLSDPNWFEAEAQRITKARIATARAAGLTVNRKQARDTDAEVRTALIRAYQPDRVSTVFDEHPDACHGRANVGQEITFEQPDGAKRAYKVIGKRAVEVPSRSGMSSTIATETHSVDYVLEDVRGNQSRADVRHVGWRHTGGGR